ncbi:MAG: hypothetical protein CMH22_06085 [Methylophaga sp.]|nr:hypothetical protein [Methylophaga sp.]|tara:strand:+ start:52610 stop:52921 length:312 start_codon:yes stop_codon:yes gene_type:complete
MENYEHKIEKASSYEKTRTLTECLHRLQEVGEYSHDVKRKSRLINDKLDNTQDPVGTKLPGTINEVESTHKTLIEQLLEVVENIYNNLGCIDQELENTVHKIG